MFSEMYKCTQREIERDRERDKEIDIADKSTKPPKVNTVN